MLHKVKQYSEHSSIVRAFMRFLAYWRKQSEKSFFLSRWRKDWGIENAWKNSLLFLPIKWLSSFFNWGVKKQKLLSCENIEESRVLRLIRRSIKQIAALNTRHVGIFLLTFVISEGTLWLIFQSHDLLNGLLRFMLLVLALGLILLNRSFEMLIKGSLLMKLISNIFEIRGMDDATGHK